MTWTHGTANGAGRGAGTEPGEQPKAGRRRGTKVVVVTLTALLLFGVAQAAEVNAVFLNGRLSTPQLVTSTGFQSIGFLNVTGDKAAFQLFRLTNGTELADFEAANDAVRRRAEAGADTADATEELLEGAEALGGLSVSKHSDKEIVVELRRGTYVVMADPEGEGEPVYSTFRVIGGPDVAADAPQGQNVASFSSTACSFPKEVTSGEALWEVNNTGDGARVAQLYRLLPGQTLEDLMAYLGGEEDRAPYDKTASVAAVSPGATVFVPLNLDAGRWVAISAEAGADQEALASAEAEMVREFLVN